MSRKVRLLARYSTDLLIQIECAPRAAVTRLTAKDISRSGLFVRSNRSPELSSSIRLKIALPWDGTLVVVARVAHIITPERAARGKAEAGFGVEFQQVDETSRRVLDRLVAWARDADPGRTVPTKTEVTKPPGLNPILDYVLTEVDGRQSIDQIADELELAHAAAESIIIQLNDLGLVRLGEAKPVLASLRPAPNANADTTRSPLISSAPVVHGAGPKRLPGPADAIAFARKVAAPIGRGVPPPSNRQDWVRQRLIQAERAVRTGDMKDAATALELLEALEWDNPELHALYIQLEYKVCAALANIYEQKARNEMSQQRWKQAARLWQKVCCGRPDDPVAYCTAAETLIAAQGDLHKARDLAQIAVSLNPRDATAHRLLGHIYLEAGMPLNARRELEEARSLNAEDRETLDLIKRVKIAS